jgi:hypothetical protein
MNHFLLLIAPYGHFMEMLFMDFEPWDEEKFVTTKTTFAPVMELTVAKRFKTK